MDTQKIGIYLKQLRKESGYTQQDVAGKLNISPQAISKWERCECLPDISILPEVAEIYGVKIEHILNAGLSKENPETITDLMSSLNKFVDDELFHKIVDIYEISERAEDIDIPADIFMFLNQEQKLTLIEILFDKPDYDIILDEILQYTNNALRRTILDNLLYNKDYETLELFIPFLTKSMKTVLVSNLLENEEYETLEDNITFFNKIHKDMIIEHIMTNNINMEILEGFIPFFDNKQKDTISLYLKEELK